MYWSIIRQDVRTEEERAAFFLGGRDHVAAALLRAESLGYPEQRRRALDFGCGAGRLTRALAEEFECVVGVDIAQRMVNEARLANADCASCRFDVVRTPDLGAYETGAFDLVLSHLVLQHLPSRALIVRYVGEFVRVVRPGGIVIFQLPSAMPAWQHLQPRRRAYSLLRRVGIGAGPLFRVGLHPIRMIAVRRAAIEQTLSEHGARLLAVDRVAWPTGIESATYFATR